MVSEVSEEKICPYIIPSELETIMLVVVFIVYINSTCNINIIDLEIAENRNIIVQLLNNITGYCIAESTLQ
jgi:hypothetical protein